MKNRRKLTKPKTFHREVSLKIKLQSYWYSNIEGNKYVLSKYEIK